MNKKTKETRTPKFPWERGGVYMYQCTYINFKICHSFSVFQRSLTLNIFRDKNGSHVNTVQRLPYDIVRMNRYRSPRVHELQQYGVTYVKSGKQIMESRDWNQLDNQGTCLHTERQNYSSSMTDYIWIAPSFLFILHQHQ